MSVPTAFNAIRTRLADMTLTGTPPIKYDNQPEGTNTGHFQRPDNSEWLQLHITVGDAALAMFGAQKTYRHIGIATVSIHSPLGKGDKTALDLAEEINQEFRLVTFSSVRAKVPIIRPIGQVQEKWWRVDVIIPFTHDEVV